MKKIFKFIYDIIGYTNINIKIKIKYYLIHYKFIYCRNNTVQN